MNKLFNKIATGIVGIALAIGVGVAVGSNSNSTRAEAVADKTVFTKITSLSDLVDNCEIVITNIGGTYALSTTQNDNNRGQTSISGGSGSFTYSSSSAVQVLTVRKWTISSSTYYGFHTGSGFLYSPQAKNYLRTDTNAVTTNPTSAQTFTFSLSISSGTITANCAGRTSYYLQYNSGSSIFSCYKNTMPDICIYRASNKITFNANGGTGTVPSNITGWGTKTLPSSASLTKTGYTLDGWGDSSHKDDATAQYALGASYNLSADITLYAHWSINKYKVGGTISNGALSSTADVSYNNPLSITINPDDGHTFPSVLDSVTMGNADYTGYTYNPTNGSFYIEHVTGDVSITARCPSSSAQELGITYDLTGCTTDGPNTMYSDENLIITISALDHYKLPLESDNKVSVTGSNNWNYSYNNGTITINGAQSALTVTIECIKKVTANFNTSGLTNVSAKAGNPTTVEEGQTVTLYFEANEGYGLPASVTVNGAANQTWNQSDGSLQVTGGTNDTITISITGVTKTLISISLGTTSGSHKLGDVFSIPTVTATFNTGPEVVASNITVESTCLDEDNMFVETGSNVQITIKYTYAGETRSAIYTATSITARVITDGGYKKITSSRTNWSGEYVITSSSYLLGNSVNNNRIENNSTSPEFNDDESKLITEVTNEMKWTIASVTGGYTIKNNGNNKYLASNGNEKQAAMVDSLDNDGKTTWTISFSSGIFTIVNKYLDGQSSTKKTLRNNGTNGWACYDASTGSGPMLYEYEPPVENVLTKVTASLNTGKYFQGETLTADNFVVTAHYADASSNTVSSNITITNGTLSNVGNNNVTISYGGKSTKVVVNALAPATVTGVDLVVPANYNKSYVQGDDPLAWNLSGLIVRCTWSNEDLNEDLTLSDLIDAGTASISPLIPTVGVTSFTISYTYYGTSISAGTATVTGISVVDDQVDHISWTGWAQGEFDVYDSDSLTESEAKDWTVKQIYNVKSAVVLPYGSYDILINDTKVTLPYQYKVGDTKISVKDPSSGKVANKTVTVTEDSISSISATCSKTFKVGETITKSDVTLTVTYTNPKRAAETVSDFVFADYQFTYGDAASGGSDTNKNFSISYGGKSCTLTTVVSRNSYTPAEETYITLDDYSTLETGSATNRHTGDYTFNDKDEDYDYPVECHVVNGYRYNGYIQFGKTRDGSVRNKEAMDEPISSVDVTFDNVTGQVLYSPTGADGTWVNTMAEGVNYYYFLINYENLSSDPTKYTQISSIDVNFKPVETAITLSDYVMFTDTENQCETKYETAETIFTGLSDDEKSTFMTSNDYVIRTARERFINWAKHQGKTIEYSDGKYAISSLHRSMLFLTTSSPNNLVAIIITSTVSLAAIGGYFFLRKKKED